MTAYARPLSEPSETGYRPVSSHLAIAPAVSVVIPAMNEAENLPYVFNSLPEWIHEVVLVDGEPLVASFDGDLFLTVRGANEHPPENHVVTVDAGAISFVSDGANVMRPGITEATDDIEPGDLVVIVEETHRKALAIGRAETTGDDMVGDSGKVVESLHHVGDELYEFRV
jgi:PUA domain protein